MNLTAFAISSTEGGASLPKIGGISSAYTVHILIFVSANSARRESIIPFSANEQAEYAEYLKTISLHLMIQLLRFRF